VLCDDAADWWEMHGQDIFTWEEFKSQFLRAFCASNHKLRLKQDLERRFQGPHEPGTVFLRKIAVKCKEIDDKTADKEIIELVVSRLNPAYATLTLQMEFASIKKLEEHLHKIEACQGRVASYIRPRELDKARDGRFAYDPKEINWGTFSENSSIHDSNGMINYHEEEFDTGMSSSSSESDNDMPSDEIETRWSDRSQSSENYEDCSF
jgi:hypothetical protein